MRDIKFRALDIRGKDRGIAPIWMYFTLEDLARDVNTRNHFLDSIDPKTIGQYTSLKDKNGKEVYEGDIVKVWEVLQNRPVVVFYEQACWLISKTGTTPSFHLPDYSEKSIEVIGNIYENPEFIEDKNQ